MARTVVITQQGIPGVPGAGGYVPGGTDVAVADGGTGASSAAAARTNLGAAAASDLTAAETALDARLDVLEADSGWILPTLATDVTVNATWLHLGYRKIRGIVYSVIAVDVANPAADKLLFTLPAGYRPGISGSKRLIAGDSGLIRINPTNGEVRANNATTLFVVTVSYPGDN